jgi:hypothetical protein
MTQAQYAEAQPDGQQGNVLTRQLGPLKTWQWGIAVAGAVLVYKYVLGGGGGNSGASTTTTVPTSDSTSGGTSGNDTGIGATTVQNITNQFTNPLYKYFYAVLTGTKNPLYNSKGKLIGYTKARKLWLGKPIKIRGIWYYPILNMPGKYLKASSHVIIESTTTPPPGAQVVQNAVSTATSSTIGTSTVADKTSMTTAIMAPRLSSPVLIGNVTDPHIVPTPPGPITIDGSNIASLGISSPSTT